MKKYIKFFLVISFLLLNYSNVSADTPYYLDFKFILNESTAGKKAQDELKNRLNTNLKKLTQKEKAIQEEEKQIIQQKKLIKPEEYKKKVEQLRSKVTALQKERNQILQNTSAQRSKARNTLLRNLNPIIKEYMQEKKIRMVVDKKSLLLADENLDITNDIINILNKKLKSIKLD